MYSFGSYSRIGVLHDDDLAGGRAKPVRSAAPLPAIDLVIQPDQIRRRRPSAARMAAVPSLEAIVDDDDLLVDIDGADTVR